MRSLGGIANFHPLNFKITKEMTDVILAGVNVTKKKIEELKPSGIVISGETFIVHHRLLLTMIEVARMLKGVNSMARYFICWATLKLMNSLDAVHERQVSKETLQ